MDVSFVIRQRLELLGVGQKDLARAARVTESYVSQLLSRKKAPPAPGRTDIYDRMDRFLKLPTGELAKLADLQRKDELKRGLGDEPTPLFSEVRALILRKCRPEKEREVRAVFEKQPFGELERLVTQKLLDVVKHVARRELQNDYWLRTVAQLGGRSFEEMRVIVLEFLDTDIFHLSVEHCVSFLDPLIASWDIDLATFGLEIVLNEQVAADHVHRIEFVERESEGPAQEPGLHAFLHDPSLSGTATAEEVAFLSTLRFQDKRPTALYYYRELQSLRDPLHFRTVRTGEPITPPALLRPND
ncbi:MAG: helix-turn-helix transcriptional regulator [Gemmatimonadota bacterium]|nr:helix-turn-helix transcriptional regulator [Gemmatimonadota bacterium]MDH4349935.1 helix-turn-helix transcriptional regulator [Gemmatimonadota bacterium]